MVQFVKYRLKLLRPTNCFHSTHQARARQASKESKTAVQGRVASRTMKDQIQEPKTMEEAMEGPRMVLTVVLVRIAWGASATKTMEQALRAMEERPAEVRRH